MKGVTMRLLQWAMVSLVLLSTPAQAWEWRWPWTSADESANKLFVEAVPLWNQYQALPEEDPAQYEARLQLLNQIDKNLKSILKDYPESSLAVELVSTGALKQLNQEQIEAEIPRLQQSIPAATLLAETRPLWLQYQALPQDDPAQYEARLKLLTQVDVKVDRILNEYPLSYEAGPLVTGPTIGIKAEIPRLQESIPASALMAETSLLWEQYQALPTDDPAQYGARLKLLSQVDVNLDKLIKDYQLSYEVENLSIDRRAVKAEIPRLQQSIPASALMAKTRPLWQKYQALPTDDPAQYGARLKLLSQVNVNLDKLIKDYQLSYEVENLSIDTKAIKAEIPRLQQSIPASALMAETSPLWQQYQALPTDDPARYEARLKLLTQVNVNLDKLIKDYWLSYEAQNLSINTKAIKAEIPRLQQSIPASALMAETQQLWQQHQALPTDDPAQYGARLKLLTQVDGNLDTLLKNYPLSYEAQNLSIDTKAIKAEIPRLQQSIPASALMAETSPLWQQYQALPQNELAHYETRLKLLTQVDANVYKLLWDYPLSYEAKSVSFDTKELKAEIQRLTCAPDIHCLLRLALRTTEGVTSPLHRASAFAAIAGAQAVAGDVEGALKTAEGINSPNDQARAAAFAGIARAQAAAGDIEGALKTVELTVNRTSALAAIAGAQAAAGDLEGALKTVEGINFLNDLPSALAQIAGGQAAAGDVGGALKTAKSIKDAPFYRASAFAAIAGAQAVAGDVEGALKTAEGIKSPNDQASAFAAIAGAQVKAGDIEGALKTAEAISSSSYQAKAFAAGAFAAIARAQAAAGDVEGALKTAALGKKAALGESQKDRASAFAAIAHAQAASGDVEGALKTVEGVQDSLFRATAFTSIAAARFK
jgi:hypothetical protein